MTNYERLIDTQHKDGDPRKWPYLRSLIERHSQAIKIWHEFGSMERKPGKNFEISGSMVRKHGAPEHMIGGAANCEALGQMLEEKGELDSNDICDVIDAVMVHDSGKPAEVGIIRAAMADDVSWDKVEAVIKTIEIKGRDGLIVDIKGKWTETMQPNVNKGERIYIARAMIAGKVHKERLKQAGVSDRVIELQSATEYSSCPEVEDLVDNFDNLSAGERKLAIQKMMVHWIDDGMKESVMSTVDDRCEAVFKKPDNILLSEAYRQHNKGGESAKDIQIRVGHKVIDLLARLAGVEPEELLSKVDERVRENM